MATFDRRQFLRRSTALAAAVAAGSLPATACSGSGSASDGATVTRPTDRVDVARDAFLAGVPLVTTMRTLQTFAQLVGINQLVVPSRLADPGSRTVVAPNRDTVYAIAVLDLRAGPQVLTVPDIPDRYHVLQLLDAWMGGFGLIGTRATDGRAGSWAIVPPGHTEPIPGDLQRLECPTNHAFVLGRVRAVDDADAPAASAVARGIRLEPLAQVTGQATEPAAPAAEALPPPAGTPQAVGTNGLGFFDELGDALVANPPVTGEQQDALAAAGDLGVGPGEHPGSDPDGPDADVLRQGVEAGLRVIDDRDGAGSRIVGGWAVNLELGTADTDQGLPERAVIARWFWGPVPAEEAVYPLAVAGSDGEPLDGGKRYRIRFPAGQLPPVDAFWSLTVYGPDMFLWANPANRYAISGDTPGLVTNADGSLDVHLQHEPPAGEGARANWLPVPDGPFHLIMRLYLPQRPIVDGSYEYPPITVVS